MATAITYSNGYRVDDVMTAIMNRRRWRQPTRADFPITLTDPNIWATGDVNSPVFEAEHKAVSVYNVCRAQEDDAITALNFNTYLQQLQKDVVLKCLNNVFNKREALEKKLLFERFGRPDYLDTKSGIFACVRIMPAKAFDISVQIDNIALKFDSSVTFNMYLFHDTQPTSPIYTKSVTTASNKQTIINIGQVLSYAGAGNKSGSYYFGYFQDDIGSATAINEIVQQFNPMYNFGCVPVELPKVGSGVNINQISFTIKTHGFNIQLSAFRDYTQLIVDTPWLFDNLIGLQMAADVIEMIQNSTRTNKDQRQMFENTAQLNLDLNMANGTDEVPFAVGLRTRISREANRIKQEFFPTDKVTSITHDTENHNIYGAPADSVNVVMY